MESYYKKLIAWQKSRLLAKEVYILVQKFPKEETYALRDQIQRASISIPSNIAEWSGRWWNTEYKRFLHIAKWSACELETQIILAEDLWYIWADESKSIQQNIDEVLKLISWLIRNLN
jgi:four helix bundle protein